MYVTIGHDRKISEWLEPQNLQGGPLKDLDIIMKQNEVYRQVMARKDSGRPGHYYGRDVVIEGAVPIAAFLAAAIAYGGDQKWWRDDKKFQDFMKSHPGYSWLNG
jgi:hypothetical protein